MASTKRKAQSKETQSRIIAAAVGLLKDRRIDEVGVQEICETAAVGVGTFYHYFKSKDDVFFAVYGEMDDFFREIEPVADTLSVQAFILQHCQEYGRFIAAHHLDFTKAVYAMQHPSFCDNSRPVYSRLFQHISLRQQQGQVSAALDVEELCVYMLVLLRGITYDWCVHGGQYDLCARLGSYMEKALHAYAPVLGISESPL